MDLDLAMRVALEVEHPCDPETAGNLRANLDHTRRAARVIALELQRLRAKYRGRSASLRSLLSKPRFTCAYCGAPANTREEILAHLVTCVEHPTYKMLHWVLAFRGALGRDLERLTDLDAIVAHLSRGCTLADDGCTLDDEQYAEMLRGFVTDLRDRCKLWDETTGAAVADPASKQELTP